jgi:DNA-binding PadR family transcriptional regulator
MQNHILVGSTLQSIQCLKEKIKIQSIINDIIKLKGRDKIALEYRLLCILKEEKKGASEFSIQCKVGKHNIKHQLQCLVRRGWLEEKQSKIHGDKLYFLTQKGDLALQAYGYFFFSHSSVRGKYCKRYFDIILLNKLREPTSCYDLIKDGYAHSSAYSTLKRYKTQGVIEVTRIKKTKGGFPPKKKYILTPLGKELLGVLEKILLHTISETHTEDNEVLANARRF